MDKASTLGPMNKHSALDNVSAGLFIHKAETEVHGHTSAYNTAHTCTCMNNQWCVKHQISLVKW